MGYKEGLRGENNFVAELNKAGIPYTSIDTWYDFEVLGQKVEVKSCKISIKNGKHNKIGRFDFTDENNRQKQYDSNIWVCFIIRRHEKYIILGLTKAKKLNKKRYVSIHEAIQTNPTPLEEWLEKQSETHTRKEKE